jgi:predicted esterase
MLSVRTPSHLALMTRHLFAALLLLGSIHAQDIPRRLPPPGTHIPSLEVLQAQKTRLAKLEASELEHPRYADAAIYSKAVRLAHRHGEFYGEKASGYVDEALDRAEERLSALAKNQTPWLKAGGLITCGFRSKLDDSIQPYGLEIPDGLNLSKKVPLYVWLHGRGDKNTDLYFLRDREKKRSPFKFEDGITLHPFGRQCIGFKAAGEIDVLEAITDVKARYRIKEKQIVLLGFSMGGAGAWHLGAHYADQWAAVHAGAGFAETAQYIKLKPVNYPPCYEQTLWSVYDVPNYARNLLNQPLVAYSGEKDKQIQAALVMEGALREHDHKLYHVIGPNMGHKYDEDSIKEIGAWLKDRLAQADEPKETWQWQTRTLRYPGDGPFRITGLHEHYQDSRLDAKLVYSGLYDVTTVNVTSFTLREKANIWIDGQLMTHAGPGNFQKGEDGIWTPGIPSGLQKRPGLQGPIDDAFLNPFLEVTEAMPSNWHTFERTHFHDRWSALFRGEVPSRSSRTLSKQYQQDHHLLYWGTPHSSPAIRKLIDTAPIDWDTQEIRIGDQSWPSANHMLLLIYPNPDNPEKYIVLNSGPTFREAHDRTNSLQNPKLGDWAVIDTRTPPNAEAAGKVVASGFFDERWQVK